MDAWVYRIVPASEWDLIQRRGAILSQASDRSSGFMHLSNEAAVLETVRIHFANQAGLVALRIMAGRLKDELRWEPVASRRGQRFPHYYGEKIPATAVDAWREINADASGVLQLGPLIPWVPPLEEREP